jgi:P4 family phage/plasmid primase-like protien
MSGVERETPPAGDRGREGQESSDSVPCQNSPILPGIDGVGDGNCLLSFLQVWSPAGPWWPTAIPREGGGTATATITTPAQMTAWADARRGVDNLYFHVNDLSPNTRKKGDKGDVTRIRGFHVDIDARPPEGGWPKDPSPERLVELAAHCVAEHARIGRDVVSDKFWASKGLKRPTAIIDSGGGFQCFWLLHDDEVVAPDAAEAVNRMLAALLDGDDAVVDVSRIMRLPGAVNLAGKKKRERGRMDSPTLLLEADGSRRFRAGDFPAPAVTVAPAATPAAGAVARVALSSDLPRVQNLDDLGPGVSDKLKAMIVQGTDPEEPGKYGSRSEAAWAVICMMVRAGCSNDQIAAVILDPDYKISGHVLDQPHPVPYAARQIERAREENPPPGPIVMPTALNLARAYREARRPHLLHHQQEFLEWDGAAYGAVADDAVRAGMWTFLETCRVEGEKGEEPKPLHPNSKVVSGAVDALKAVVHLSPPHDAARVLRWLDGRDGPDPAELVPSPGGVLNLRTGEVMPATPQLFARTGLDFTPDPAAPDPELWLKFLGQVWPDDDDPACIRTLQEFMGYLLTPDTRLQKALMMVGPPASGKGTILKVMARLVGLGNTTSPSMNSLSNGRFGLAPLLNKTLMTVGDMRIGPKTDIAALEENLLRITGEDRVSVDRKSISAVEVRLTARMAIATNELPRFNDSSGALARRLITLTQRQSFKDNPDMELEEKLARELPGILNWAMVGWRSVRDNKRITEPESSRVAARDLVDLASPVPEFVDDCCILGPFEVDKNELFETFRAWFKDRFGEEWRSGKVHFFKALYPCTPGVGDKNGSTPDGGRVKRVKGLKLNDFWAKGRIGGRASG